MLLLTQTLWVGSFLLELALLWRGKKAGLLSQLPFFYSYIGYTLLWSFVTLPIFWFRSDLYSSAYWLFYLVNVVAEFAILVEISDHVFAPFAALRYLGRVIATLISLALSVGFIIPALARHLPSGATIINFCLWASLTKTLVVLAVIVAARYYRLRLSRSAAALVTGFGLYLSIYATNFAAAAVYGKVLYAAIFRFIMPSGWLVCLLTWTVALWKLESSKVTEEKQEALQFQPYPDLSHKINRLNDALSTWLRK